METDVNNIFKHLPILKDHAGRGLRDGSLSVVVDALIAAYEHIVQQDSKIESLTQSLQAEIYRNENKWRMASARAARRGNNGEEKEIEAQKD